MQLPQDQHRMSAQAGVGRRGSLLPYRPNTARFRAAAVTVRSTVSVTVVVVAPPSRSAVIVRVPTTSVRTFVAVLVTVTRDHRSASFSATCRQSSAYRGLPSLTP